MKIKRFYLKDNNLKEILFTLKRDLQCLKDIEAAVKEIVSDVKENGDKALFSYTEKFDKVKLSKESLSVTKEEISAAYDKVDKDLLSTLKKSAENIRSYHEMQIRQSFLDSKKPGIMLGQKITPIENVGVYVPGGKAFYPSTVLMDVIPAAVAGCENIIITTPAGADSGVNPTLLVAADIAGAKAVYKVGGAQAVAALAYGTESIPKVDKIVGPGNIYVATAKRLVFGDVGIDSVAGPSEITVVADASANPRFVAADLLSQAEHDEMAQSILVTESVDLADKVEEEIRLQTEKAPRKDIIKKSLQDFGLILITNSVNESIEAANIIAPEHLEVMVEDAFSYLPLIKNAGAIFLGNYSCEPLGDYFAGPCHVLPTNGTARFFSPLGVDDFIKKSSVICYNKEAFHKVFEDVIRFAESEGLFAHANSAKVREEEF